MWSSPQQNQPNFTWLVCIAILREVGKVGDDGKFSIYLQMNLMGSIHVLGQLQKKNVWKIYGLMVDKDLGLIKRISQVGSTLCDVTIICSVTPFVFFLLSVTGWIGFSPQNQNELISNGSVHHALCSIATSFPIYFPLYFPMKQTGERGEIFSTIFPCEMNKA